MGDLEAGAVAAGRFIKANGKEYHLRPVRFRVLKEVQQEALRKYKRRYLETYQECLDLLNDADAKGAMAKKLDEVAKWTVRNLPMMQSFSCRDVPITDAAREWIVGYYHDAPSSDEAARYLLSTALDHGAILPDEVESMCGVKPESGRVPYDLWWITAERDGMETFIHAALWEEHRVTSDEIGQWPFTTVVEAARTLELMTAPDVGN